MKTRIIVWVAFVALAAFGLYALDAMLMQKELAEKTVRLHVVANSDSQEDQEQKLRVRDAVLEEVGTLTATCKDAQEARTVIAENLEQLQSAAQEVLAAEGSSYSVRVSLGVERFDTRYYDTFTLPAGKYPALRVQIGAAQGQNWWCVVFPSLCTAATSDAVEQSAMVGGFDETQTQFITGGEEEYSLRFKTLEWLKSIAAWFD
ncbi:MAG: stage II sporulation protein R [Oscillospiraceae bacterium]|jgi:stage II sporulation protein R|nr:stage II sporulation protein R [Oscillospiraceae bacterium]